MNTQQYDSVMLDLETLDTSPTALILSIGAFKFNLADKDDPKVLSADRKFHVRINIADSIIHGLTISGDTLKWWFSQSKEAQNAFLGATCSMETALRDFSEFVSNKEAYIWGNGATFDNVILRNAFKSCKLTYPVSFRNDLCYRTIRRLISGPPHIQYGVLHNALDDAIAQALTLQTLYAVINEKIHVEKP